MALSLSLPISVLSIVLLLRTFSQVSAHGFLSDPRTRGGYTNQKVKPDVAVPKGNIPDNCLHCLNGGGKAAVMKASGGNWRPYNPLKNQKLTAGLCGDALGNNDHMIGGKFVNYPYVPIVRAYKPGQVVDFEIELDTNHNGYFRFYICNLDHCGKGDISPECFAKGSCKLLERVANPKCDKPSPKTRFQCGPKDADRPGRFYVPCRDGPHVGVHMVGGSRGTMKYKLPNETCKHCVIHWYWATANSCNPPGFIDYFKKYNAPFGNQCDGDGGARGARAEHLSPCGGSNFPEEFWGCSDVSVTADGKSKPVPARPLTGPARTMKPNPTMKPEPTMQPTMQPQPTQTKQPRAEPTETPHSGEQTQRPMHSNNHHNDDRPKDPETRKGPPSSGQCTNRYQGCIKTARCCDNQDICILKNPYYAQCVPIEHIRSQ